MGSDVPPCLALPFVSSFRIFIFIFFLPFFNKYVCRLDSADEFSQEIKT